MKNLASLNWPRLGVGVRDEYQPTSEAGVVLREFRDRILIVSSMSKGRDRNYIPWMNLLVNQLKYTANEGLARIHYKYECRNWERGPAVSFLGIHKLDFSV
jgi:hypothetical protein